MNVLCLEDDVFHRKIITKIIAKMNFEAFSTSRVEEAHRILKQEKIDCFVTDYLLKDNDLNGIEFLEKLKAEGFNKPVIFVTSELSVVNYVAEQDEHVMVVIKEDSYYEDLMGALHNVYALWFKEKNGHYQLR